MLYHYLASNLQGKITEGEVDADSVNGVLQYLVGRELRPITVKAIKREMLSARRISRGIKIRDKIFLCKYLSLMLRVGTDLLSAINILIVDFESPAMKNFLLEVRDVIVKGRPFHEAFSRYPKVFSPVFVNLVKSAEAAGNLQQTFEDLSVSLAKEAELRGQIRSALVYPTVLLTASLFIFGFISVFALPRVADVFIKSGINPPTFSRIVFSAGLFINEHIIVIASALVVCIGFSVFFFRSTLVGRRIGGRILNHTPVIKRARRDLAIQQLASTLSSLLKAGLPIIDAIKITANTIAVPTIHDALIRISDEGLAKGLTVSEAFRREPVFPRVVVNLIAISERAGHLEEVLGTLADFYAANISTIIKTLISFIEPALLIFMGLLVGLVALSIIIPIYQLTTQF